MCSMCVPPPCVAETLVFLLLLKSMHRHRQQPMPRYAPAARGLLYPEKVCLPRFSPLVRSAEGAAKAHAL